VEASRVEGTDGSEASEPESDASESSEASGPEAQPDASPYRRLFRNAGRQAWDPDRIDLSRDREDWVRIREDYPDERYGEQIHRLCSLFFEGEQSVTETLAPFLGAMNRAGLGVDPELHLAAQVYEEARHFAFFDRYFEEVIGDRDTGRHMGPAPRAVLVDDLDDVAQRIRREDDPDRLPLLLTEGVTHYMGIVEAMLARTGYRGAGEALGSRGWLPGLQEGFRLIRRDEGRHVAFGIHFIQDMTTAVPARRDRVLATFERHLPNVLDTVGSFYEFDEPIVDVDALQEYALAAYRQFMAAAGLESGMAGELGEEVDEA
jgi:ribonucleoside-diphosphate reductase beta chain